MSREEYDDNCPGCRPAIIDVKTGKVLPDDDPVMVRMIGIWATSTLEERKAFHRVMCLNSRAPVDLLIVGGLTERLEKRS